MSNKNKYKALVIDDERLARRQLIEMLGDYNNISHIYEAEDVKSSIKIINKEQPNLLFLDIQMPGESGFDLLEQIDYDGKIIFVTAYDEFALRAFEVNALDYIMKPVTPERLKASIDRLEETSSTENTEHKSLQLTDRLFLTVGINMHFVNVNSILCVQSDGDYTNIQTLEGLQGLVSKSMNEWDQRLPKNHFTRIHRSTIINLNYIEKIEKWFNYSYRVFLKNVDEPFIISRRYAKQLKEKYG